MFSLSADEERDKSVSSDRESISTKSSDDGKDYCLEFLEEDSKDWKVKAIPRAFAL